MQSLSSISRNRMRVLWDRVKYRDFAEMAADEREIALIMVDHDKEYFDMFEQAGADGRFISDVDVDPYLHVILHHIVEQQVEKKEPAESYRFYNAMREHQCTHHDAVHLTMLVFTEFIFDAIKDGVPFDFQAYATLLTELTERKPTQIQDLLEQAFSG